MLSLLRSTLGASISLYLNPQTDLTDLPLKAFYRYALPEFEPGVPPASSSLPGSPLALLSRLPQKRVLTINMDVPEPWLVEPTQVHTMIRRLGETYKVLCCVCLHLLLFP